MRVQNCTQNQNFGMIRVPSVLKQPPVVDKLVAEFLAENTHAYERYTMEQDGLILRCVRYIFSKFGSPEENSLLAKLRVHDPKIQAMERAPLNPSRVYARSPSELEALYSKTPSRRQIAA